MAKKKKGNMKNIQPGATVQFLNYLTPDHILRGKYNIGNNELDITDVPANLNSVITLGQGGGGGSLSNPKLTITAVNESASPSYFRFYWIEDGVYNDGYIDIASQETIIKEGIFPFRNFLNNYIYMPESSGMYSNMVNCTMDDGNLIITDPTLPASATFTL